MIRVTDIRVCEEETRAVLIAHVQCEEPCLNGVDFRFSYPREYRDYVSTSADPWIALLLWPAMRFGRRLSVDAAGSAKLLEAVPTLMSIMRCWDDRFRPVEVETRGVSSQGRPGEAVASFFSGGVDSFYTALKHGASTVPSGKRITHLISVHGLDVTLDHALLWGRIRGHLSDAATHLGCSWVECSMNIHDVIKESMIRWQMYYGAVLAAIALGLQGLWGKVFIPADQTYAEMFPSGSHPVLDSLWSTESLHVVNDGAEATRIQKIQWQIARSDVALRHLRVCWENRNSEYNCGQCEKCIRTMVGLTIAGVLDQCQSFDRALDYRSVARVHFTSVGQRTLMAQNYEAARAAGLDPALIRALRTCLHPPFRWKLRRGLYRRARRLALNLDRSLLGGRLLR